MRRILKGALLLVAVPAFPALSAQIVQLGSNIDVGEEFKHCITRLAEAGGC